MPRLVVDDRQVEVDDGTTVLEAARKLGIQIPTMCFLTDYKPSTSCMVCVVKVEGTRGLIPACGTIAEDGMQVETNSDQVKQARTAALELLLSAHVGDCMGPCHITCPAKMNIPLMIRQIAAGDLRDAIATIKKDIALPAVLGRICPAPCEKACRRRLFDEAVSICLLKRYAADVDLQSTEPYLPVCKVAQNKRVAVIGAGPAGLAAAYYLLQKGYGCTIFDDHERPGGMLRYGVPEEQLPKEILDKEVALIEKLGVEFRGRTRIGTTLSMEDLRRDFDAIFVAAGRIQSDERKWLGLEKGPSGIVINHNTHETNLPGVFAGGDAVGKRRLAVRAVAHGKEAVAAIDRYLSGKAVTGSTREFNSHIGKLKDGEMENFMIGVSESPPVTVSREGDGFSNEQARAEAARCLHCDCRKAEACKLRQYAYEYGARQGRYKGERRLFIQHVQHPDVVYEPGKCIDCGLCIQVASEAGEDLGLTFIGRGFDVQVAVPFGRSIAEGLKRAASKCVAACPTAALAFKDKT